MMSPVNSPMASGTTAIELSDTEFNLFRRWLYKTAGIHLADAKRALVAGRLSKRLRELELDSYKQYFDCFIATNNEDNNSECQTAIDLLTTNETFFFREIGHFDYLRQKLFTQWGTRAVRCWSAASSSGEEAYSLAMTLAEHYPGNWQIIGTDINSQVVESAERAVYPMLRSENIPKRYLREFCRKGTGNKANTFKIAPQLRQDVKFSCANLQQPQTNLGQFDLIFLRNVMIYFDKASKERVVNHVIDCLKPGGILFVGHAESLSGVTDRVKLVSPSIYMCEGTS
ncbi:MAG: chemotaxis protein methyltransferase CheR [Oleispira sp.]|jgi:chemotaxis protein methyltransferase CheR